MARERKTPKQNTRGWCRGCKTVKKTNCFLIWLFCELCRLNNVQRSKEGQLKRREMRQHMWHTVKPQYPFTPKRACSHERRWRRDRRWLIVVLLDGCMGSWKDLDGLARMNEQLYGSPRFSLDRTRKTWYTFANGERPQSERDVAFQVDVGGKMGDCKIAYLNATGVPILLSVHSISKMDDHCGLQHRCHISFGIWQTRTLSCWKKKANGHPYLSLVKDMLSQITCDEDQLLGFQAAARVLDHLGKKGQDPPFAHADGRTGELLKENSDGKNLCLDTSLQSSRIRYTDPSQHTGHVTTDHLQAGSTSLITDTRQPLGSKPHYIPYFVSSRVRRDENDYYVSIGCRQSQEGRLPSIDGTSGSGTTSSGSADGIEGHNQRLAVFKRRWTWTASLGSRKNEQESTGGQGPTAEYSHCREPHEGTLDSAHKRKPHAAVDTSGIGLSGIRQAWFQDISGGPEVGSRILPMDRPRGGSTIPLESSRGSLRGWRCSVFTKKRTWETIWDRNAWRDASNNLGERNCSTTALDKKNLVLKEQVRQLMEQVQLLMKPSQKCCGARSAKSSSE